MRRAWALILTAIVAFGGVGLFRFAQALAQAAAGARWQMAVVAVFLFVGVALLGVATLYLTGTVGKARRKAEEHALERLLDPPEQGADDSDDVSVREIQASFFLGLSPSLILELQESGRPDSGTSDHYRYQSLLATDTAARILSTKNHYEKKRLKAAQRFFWWALVVFFVGAMLFTAAGVYN